jgi:hemerythrin-like metal-binding protein
MPLIDWDDSVYSVGIKKMDDEHKQLVALINLLDSEKNNQNREFVEKILNTLLQYTQNHFAHEEKILKKINYSDFDNHVAQHRKFENWVDLAKADFDVNQKSEYAINRILTFLKKWLMDHILEQDKNYGKFLTD